MTDEPAKSQTPDQPDDMSPDSPSTKTEGPETMASEEMTPSASAESSESGTDVAKDEAATVDSGAESAESSDATSPNEADSQEMTQETSSEGPDGASPSEKDTPDITSVAGDRIDAISSSDTPDAPAPELSGAEAPEAELSEPVASPEATSEEGEGTGSEGAGSPDPAAEDPETGEDIDVTSVAGDRISATASPEAPGSPGAVPQEDTACKDAATADPAVKDHSLAEDISAEDSPGETEPSEADSPTPTESVNNAAEASNSTQGSQPDEAATQKSSGQVGSLVKSATVWTLQTSVRALNWTVLQLESAKSAAEQRDTLPSGGEWVERVWITIQPFLVFVSLTTTRSLNSVLTWSLQKLDADAVPKSTPEVEAEVSSTSLLTNFSRTIRRAASPLLKQMWRLWQRLLAITRERFFPESLKSLSDITLTTFAAILLAGILWLTSAITSGGTSSVAEVPPKSEPSLPATTAPDTSKTIPSQRQLDSIQTKMTEVTVPYAVSAGEGMVQSVESNTRGDRLIVTLSLDWYRLDENQQDQLAQDMGLKVQTLDFSKLDLLDPEGTRVARSPVIGDMMIIFKRTTDLPLEEPSPEPNSADLDSSGSVSAAPSEPSLDSDSGSDLDSTPDASAALDEPASKVPTSEVSEPESNTSAINSQSDAALDEFEESRELVDDLDNERAEL